jgi:hypothetical protein
MNKINAARRTLQKVRRDSKPVGSFESGFWRPTDAREMRAALKAVERFELARKNKGKRSGPLGYTGVAVYRALWRFVRFRDGCLCPSIERIMKACRLSRAAVVGALKRLAVNGFVSWQRRLEYTGEMGVRGREVRQATNAYVLAIPPAALALIGQIILPADAITRLRERSAFVLDCERAAFSETKLGKAFAAWGDALSTKPSLLNARNPSLGVVS